jgi:hypothetical protein
MHFLYVTMVFPDMHLVRQLVFSYVNARRTFCIATVVYDVHALPGRCKGLAIGTPGDAT